MDFKNLRQCPETHTWVRKNVSKKDPRMGKAIYHVENDTLTIKNEH